MKIKIKIYIQSWTDIITNSSSELFCVIRAVPPIIQDINHFLVSLGIGGWCYNFDDDQSCIEFSTEIGEHAQDMPDIVVPLLRKVLTDKFGENGYEIDTNVSY